MVKSHRLLSDDICFVNNLPYIILGSNIYCHFLFDHASQKVHKVRPVSEPGNETTPHISPMSYYWPEVSTNKIGGVIVILEAKSNTFISQGISI
jgi:hypothetical protein